MKFPTKDDEKRFLQQLWVEQRRVIRGFAIILFLHSVYVTVVNVTSDIVWTPLTYILLFGIYYPVSVAIVLLAYIGPYRSLPLRRVWYILLSIAGTMLGIGINLKTILCIHHVEPPASCTAQNRPVSGSSIAIAYLLLGPFLLLVVMRNSIRYQLPWVVLVVAATIYSVIKTSPSLTLVTYFSFGIIIGSQLLGILVAYNRDSIERSRYLSDKSNIDLTESLRGEIEERKKAEEKAREAEESRSRFTAVLLHEMRIPINSVILSMNDLESDNVRESLRPDQTESFDRINNGLTSIVSIINDSLDQKKMDEGKMQIVERPFVYHTMLNETIRSMESNWKVKNIEFVTDFDPRLDAIPTRIQGDDNLLRRVVANYLSNATKFTPEGGLITLKSFLEEQGDDYIWIYTHIQDSGIGISEENQRKLFKPFVQIDPEINQGGKGTGLGLSICASIITSMGGTYGVKSRVGSGSTFWFRVKLSLTDIPKPTTVGGIVVTTPRSIQQRENPQRKYRILVADDDSTTRRIMCRLLRKLGHDAEEASDGMECIEKVHTAVELQEPYDLIFMDNQMPRMTGLEAIQYLREKNFYIPIVSLTGSSLPEEAEQLARAGANMVLTKPTNIDQLRDTIRNLSVYDGRGISP